MYIYICTPGALRSWLSDAFIISLLKNNIIVTTNSILSTLLYIHVRCCSTQLLGHVFAADFVFLMCFLKQFPLSSLGVLNKKAKIYSGQMFSMQLLVKTFESTTALNYKYIQIFCTIKRYFILCCVQKFLNYSVLFFSGCSMIII